MYKKRIQRQRNQNIPLGGKGIKSQRERAREKRNNKVTPKSENNKIAIVSANLLIITFYFQLHLAYTIILISVYVPHSDYTLIYLTKSSSQ